MTDSRRDEIYAHIDRITEQLAALSEKERITWFRNNAYAKPLNFIREIEGTTYAVRAFFKEGASENITEKVQRIILNNEDKRKQL